MSRRKRFDAALARASSAAVDLRTTLDDLDGLKDEWREWFDNLPENFQQTALGEKLEEISELDTWGFETAADEIEMLVSELEATDLPRGFGRD